MIVHRRATASMAGVEAPLTFCLRESEVEVGLRLATIAKFRPVKTEILSHDAPLRPNSLEAARAD